MLPHFAFFHGSDRLLSEIGLYGGAIAADPPGGPISRIGCRSFGAYEARPDPQQIGCCAAIFFLNEGATRAPAERTTCPATKPPWKTLVFCSTTCFSSTAITICRVSAT